MKVGTDRGDKKLAKKLIGFIEQDKWKKLKKFISEENIHPGKFRGLCCKKISTFPIGAF